MSGDLNHKMMHSPNLISTGSLGVHHLRLQEECLESDDQQVKQPVRHNCPPLTQMPTHSSPKTNVLPLADRVWGGLCVKEAIDSINLKISITKGNDVFSTIFAVPLQTKFTLNMSAYECAPMLRFWDVSKLETNFPVT